MGLTVAAGALATPPAVAAQQAPVPGAAVRFAIPAGPLAAVLAEFERATGLKTELAMPELGIIQSPGVSGLLTPAEALTALLEGTSVQATFAGGRVHLGVDRIREFVAVTGRATPAVSSPRYAAPLRDIPQTIAVIPKTVIEAQGATTLSDALRNVPGITLQAGEGGGASNTAGDMFNMRGFNASNSLFVDGVRDDGLIARDVFNLEQVEVFMGPTGSDVGRGTAAGYVNMQTKTPRMEPAYAASFAYGAADRTRLTTDVNWAPVSAESNQGGWWRQTALRLNTLWQDGGVAGRDFVEAESRAIAPSIGFGVGTPTRITVSGQFVRQEGLPDYGIPGAAWHDSLLTPTTVQTAAPVRQSNFYGSAGYDYDRAAQDSVTVRAEHDVDRRLTLRHQSRYNRTHREAAITAIQNVASFNAAAGTVTLARQGNDRRNEVVSHQLSVLDRFPTGGLQHAVNAGVDLQFERQFAPVLTGLGTRAAADVYAPNPFDPVAGYAPAHSGAFTKGRTATLGVFAFDTVDLGARWQATGGARWERYDTSFRNVDATGTPTVDLEAQDSLVSGKAGLVFRATGAGNLYVGYGTSVTPPGTANFTLSAQANNQNSPSVKPQRSSNLEAGTKWDLGGGRASFMAAVFHTVNENVIYTLDATAVPPLFNQDDRQVVNGVTVGVAGQVTPRWDVLANVGFLDSRLDSQSAANHGKRLVLTPEFSGSIWSTYRLPRGITVGGGVRRTGLVYANAANTVASPGYHVADGLAEYAVNSHLSLRLNLYNLTNERYVRNVNNNGGRYNPGTPRSAMLTTAIRF
ncbi:MAG TPA: TonB-dependent siderophore receptor [Vicinamibacterales bacterium]|jgi:catecholate siderophore receptor|nr:TonB-dependent siderophore receptor [Vicinamibacterales bacterium]